MFDDVPLSNGQLSVLVLIVAVLASAVAAPVLMMPDSAKPNNGGEVATPTATPAKGTVQEFSGSEMTSVPDSHAKPANGIPAPTVTASEGSQTMRVTVSEANGELALTLEDDQTHDGRWVGIPTAWFKAHYGEIPKLTTVRHESGDTYLQPTRVENGSVQFYISEFSTNTVTFSGEVTASLSDASSDSTISYDLDSLDSASDPQIEFTGVDASETDVEAGTNTGDLSTSISIAGDDEPTGPASGEPQITVSADRYEKSKSGIGTLLPYSTTESWNNEPVVYVSVTVGNRYSSEEQFTANLTTDGTTTTVVERSIGGYQTATFTWTGSIPAGSDITLDVTSPSGNVDIEAWEVKGPTPKDVTVSADDGTSVTLGNIGEGGTASAAFDASLSASTLDIQSSTGARYDYNLTYVEHSDTTNPKVEINGNWVNVTGTLEDGETTTKTADSSWLQNGTNRVNVSVGDGSLSSDAPEPRVDIVYNHSATDKQSVDYTSSATTESYNVSKTYASGRQDATLEIPFDGRVVAIQSVEYRINESGGWTDASEANYMLDSTTLTANVSDMFGGEIPAGTTIELRTTGLKLDVINGSITVTQVSTDERVNTEFQVDSSSDGFRFNVEDSRLHYLSDESYSSGEYFIVDQNGQRLHLPNASAGDTATLRTIPVKADVREGAAEFRVPEPNTTEPKFDVAPAGKSGQAVDYTFLEAEDGASYVLFSVTDGVVRDSGTASSPLTLSDDDSEETLQFLLDDDSGGSTGGSSGGGGGIIASPSTDDFTSNLIPLSAVALAFAGLIIVSRNDEDVAQAGSNAAEGIEVLFGRIPVLGPAIGSIIGGVVRGVAQLGRALAGNRTVTVFLAGAIGVAAVQSGVVQVPDSTLPLVVLVGVAIGSRVALTETGNFSRISWVAIVASATVVTVVVISDSDVVAAVTQSRVFPLLALGGLYLGYRGIKILSDSIGGGDDGNGGSGVTIQADTVVQRDGGDD